MKKYFIIILLLGMLFLFGCDKESDDFLDIDDLSNESYSQDVDNVDGAEDYSYAKEVMISNIDGIVEDMVYILNNSGYDFDIVYSDESKLVDDMNERIGSSDRSYDSEFSYKECRYSGSSVMDVDEWISSGLLTCFENGSRPELGSYWFYYDPSEILDYSGDGHVVFEVQVKEEGVIIYYSLNPSPVMDCPNFDCKPMAFVE